MQDWPNYIYGDVLTMFDAIPSGYFVTDVKQKIVFANRYVLHLLGHQDLRERPLSDILTRASCILYESYVAPMLLREGVCDEIQLTLQTSGGEKKTVILNARMDAEGRDEIHWAFINVSQRDKLFKELVLARNLLDEKNRLLEARTFTDDLTGLANRLSAIRYLDERLQHSRLRQTEIVFICLDLDDFKALNVRYGHLVGDELLKAVGQRLAGSLRTTDMVARLNGDEFALILEHSTGMAKNDIRTIQRILNRLRAPFEIRDNVLSITASAGAAVFDPGSCLNEPEQLILQADQALCQAKLAGKGKISWFDPGREANQRTFHEFISQIRSGIRDGQFVLHYQPNINLITGAVTGFEALVRWQHPTRGLLMPIDFLPHLDNHMVEQELGEWAIESALRQLNRWRQIGLFLPVAVNVSTYSLTSEKFLDRLSTLLGNFPDVPCSQLQLQLSEKSAVDACRNISSVIAVSRQMGIQFVLCDFGTGYSTLSHLRDLSVDVLKIDSSYVQNMFANQNNTSIIKAIIGFAKAFNCRIIADGIESAQQQKALVNLGCDHGQGALIAAPMPAETIEPWMATRR